ncbi:MAG: sigma-54-dependent Fis family transcriptional regulator [Deltaproteobacteria bacterium]|nr:sigma-54-dependent Fis family transcriptional regulator [Deltaproteobacteria bacterium]
MGVVYSILIVDDDLVFRQSLSVGLKKYGFQVLQAATGQEGLISLSQNKVDCVLLDLGLPDESGLDLVVKIKTQYPYLPVIMVSASGETGDIVEAMKLGASDYLKKPINYNELNEKLKTQLEFVKFKQTEAELESPSDPLKKLLGTSIQCKLLVQEISKIANSDATVLLRGESGTGKSMVAEIIHQHSQRKNGPFVPLNCTAIPETLLESELFGHVKGAFTGAHRDRMGRFKSADGGTIFLDEIGEISTEIQVKLLRLLQGKEFEPVGSLKTIKVDVRIITATNRNLEQAIQEGKFREDLFYRLNVLPVFVPPLRERQEDISILAEHFIKNYSKSLGKNFNPISNELKNFLMQYSWPGNIRELQNVAERAVILASEPDLKVSDFKLDSHRSLSQNLEKPALKLINGGASFQSLKELEYQQLMGAIEESRGNISQVAKRLGVARDTVYRRLKKYQIALKNT